MHKRRLGLEALEARDVPAATYWWVGGDPNAPTSPDDLNNWRDSNSQVPGALPGTSDTVDFDSQQAQCRIPSSQNPDWGTLILSQATPALTDPGTGAVLANLVIEGTLTIHGTTVGMAVTVRSSLTRVTAMELQFRNQPQQPCSWAQPSLPCSPSPELNTLSQHQKFSNRCTRP